jgi:phosphate transport system protein
VATAIHSYVDGKDVRDEIFNNSEELRILQDEVSELAVELIARYQPVATDLRFIKSCMEISYGFSRFGRYAYDISDVLVTYGDLSGCDKSDISKAGQQAIDMIDLSIRAFKERDVNLAKKLNAMDDIVDGLYRRNLQRVTAEPKGDIKCFVSGTLVLRYLERIADHATYIGDSVVYIVTGERAPRL